MQQKTSSWLGAMGFIRSAEHLECFALREHKQEQIQEVRNNAATNSKELDYHYIAGGTRALSCWVRKADHKGIFGVDIALVHVQGLVRKSPGSTAVHRRSHLVR